MNKPLAVLSVSCALAMAGCGPGGGASTINDFCNSYNAAINGLAVQCFGAPQDAVSAQFKAQDAQSCKDMVQAVAAKRVIYDAKQGQACLDELGGTACPDLTTLGGPKDPCTLALTGTVAVGGSCYSDNDCKTGSACTDVTGTNCPATCNALAQQGDDCSQGQTCAPQLSCNGSTCEPGAAKGQPCGGNNTFCAAGLYCNGVGSAAGICQAKKAKGESCSNPNQCQLGLTCIGGSCAPYKTVGQTCSADGDCGLYTTCKSGNCTEWPKAGGTCGLDAHQNPVGCIDSWCNITNTTTYTGTCKAFLNIGDSCTPGAGACGIAECDNGKCTAACAEK